MPLTTLRELEAAREAYRDAVASGDEDRIKAAAIWVVQSELRHDKALGVPVVSTRSQRILPWVLIGFLIVATVSAILAANLSRDTADQLRPIIASPCQQDPSSRACAELRLEIIQAEPRYIPCTSLARIVSDELIDRYTECGDRQTREKGESDAPRPAPRAVGPSAPSPGPAAPGSGDDGDAGGGGAEPPADPAPDPEPPDTSPPDPPPDDTEPPPPAEPEPNGLGAVTEGAGQVIEGTGEIVCSTARVLCR